MSHTQNLFKTFLYNDLVESFKERYSRDDLKRMYMLDDSEADELHYFIQNTERDTSGYRAD